MATRIARTLISGIRQPMPDGDILLVGSGIDQNLSGPLSIGIGATTITIGSAGQLVSFAGDIQVDGIQTFVQGTTFQSDVTFQGDTTFGDAPADQITFAGRIAGDLLFLDSAGHKIIIDQPPNVSTPGSALSIAAAKGSNGDATKNGNPGGSISIVGGPGGDGSATRISGNGASLLVAGGDAGVDAGAGGANGGDGAIDGGAATGVGVAGKTLVGTIRSGAIEIGGTTSDPSVSILGTGQKLIDGNLDATGGLDVSGAAITASSGLILTGVGLAMTGLDIGSGLAEIGDIYLSGAARFATIADPIPVAGKGFVYAKSGATTELFFLGDAGAVRLTKGAVVSAPSVENFAFAADLGTQNITVAGTYQDVAIGTNFELDGWAHTAGTADFVCAATGKYRVSCVLTTNKTAGGAAKFTMRAVNDGAKIAGTARTIDIFANNTLTSISVDFIVSMIATKILKIEMVSDSMNMQITGGVSPGPATASSAAMITIERMS